jgi:hypothetical protein
MKQELLWYRLQWKHSKNSRLERTLEEILGTEPEKPESGP